MENPEAIAQAIFALIYAPKTPQEVQSVIDRLDYCRRLNDVNGTILCLAQLAHPDRCRLPLESEQSAGLGPDDADFWEQAAPSNVNSGLPTALPDTPTDDEGNELPLADASDMLRAWQEAQEEYEPNPYDGTYSET